jgi:hypothetical protein
VSDDTWFGPPTEGKGPAWETTEEMSTECARAVVGMVEWLVERDRYRILDCRTLEDLYGGRWVTSQDLMPGVSAYTEAGGDPVKLNFAKNAVDFVQAKLTKEVPAVVATAHGGGYSQERRADLLSRFIEDVWGRTSGDDVVKSAVLHALRTGTAIVKTHASSGRPDIEIVPAEWCFVDQTEARSGETRMFYERRPVARRYLLERFVDDPGSDEPSDAETAILGASAATDPLSVGLAAGSQTVTDLVHVYEAWSLPEDLPDAEPGRHVICVDGAVLLDEEWRFPRLPHALFRFDVAPVGRGFWAQGLLQQVDEAQAEIDYLLAQVSEQIRMARLKVFVAAQDQVLKEDHLADSAQGTIVRFDRNTGEPHFVTPPSVSREALEHIQWLVKELYEAAGMSEQGASSQRPAGVNSGRAILYFHDFQTQRFIDRVAAVGRFVVDIIERLLDRAEELHAPVDDGDGADGDGTGTPRTGDDELTWSRVRMEREDFVLGLEQISPVPRTYAGRMQRIEQLIAQGEVPPGYWAQYLSDPDAWRAEHRAAAQAEHIDWLLSELEHEDEDRPMPPLSDKLDMELAKEVLTGEVLTLIRKKADDRLIDRVEEFFDMIVQRQKELAPPQGPAQGPGIPSAPPQLPNGGLAPTTPGQ